MAPTRDLDAAYLYGFGNHHQSEAIPGALPVGRNSPQRVAHGLYTEQLSGTAFTAARHRNRRSWLYRRRPSVRHLVDFRLLDGAGIETAPIAPSGLAPAQFRWDPPTLDEGRGQTWRSGLTAIAAAGDADAHRGATALHYRCDRSMLDETFVDADGELLVLPERGRLRLVTEFGLLDIGPGELAVIPRSVKFRVEVLEGEVARGYVCENHGALLELPDPGLNGPNTNALVRDFRYPTAAVASELERPTELVLKYEGRLYATSLDHDPLDVVAWHGNHAPYAYDLRRFSALGPVVFDHPDPSIWTVLTSPSETPGVANLDLVVFRDRWSVADDTFRPPWFHTNVMSELMGLIEGRYDGKAGGFAPGGISLHNAGLPHGPDVATHQRAIEADLSPEYLDGMLAFMFETRQRWRLSAWAVDATERQHDYASHWSGLDRRPDA